MRAVVFGTAGHIDHGKTSLVLALTGVDCDRLAEEKRRGITLVLGFAPLADPAGELEISFIDVPGHERLVHTMIAGAGGIDRALLVVAADEGVMPQTREHLDILALLGVRGGVVALNKSDLLDEELLALRREELAGVLAGGPLAGGPIVPCSASTGRGIGELRQALLDCARAVIRDEERHRPFRLSVDRAFSLPGAGTVVTGTARCGRVRAGDELVVVATGRRVRVRGVQVHSASRDEGGAGERVALQLAGLGVAEVPRGEQLLSSGPWRATDRLVAEVRALGDAPPLTEGDQVRVHLLAARVLGRVERLFPDPLEAGRLSRAVLRLARPLFAAPGDRVVLRRVSPARTIGGGRVLDPAAGPVRRRDAARLADLPDPTRDLEAALAAWIAAGGTAGVELAALAARAGVTAEGLEPTLGRLLEAERIVVTPGQAPLLLARAVVAGVVAEARALLARAGAVGLPLAELLARLLPDAPSRLRELYLDALRRSGALQEVAGRAVAADLAPVDDPLAARLEALYRDARFAAPSPEEAANRLGAKAGVVEGLVRFLVDRKRLARVGGKWILHRAVLDDVAASLRSWGVVTFDVGQFKDRFGLTRKLAIPVLEWLDSERVTRREGETRRVLPPRAGRSSAG